MIGPYGGMAKAGDKLQGLLGGTVFSSKPAGATENDYAKILQQLMQDPNISQYISTKMNK